MDFRFSVGVVTAKPAYVMKHWSYEESGYEVEDQIPSSAVQKGEQITLDFQSA
jgi:hypothetical protein